MSQLASHNYQNTPEEAAELVRILDEDMLVIARNFGVEYATRIGKAASNSTADGPAANQPLPGMKRVSILDEIEVVKILEMLRKQDIAGAERALRQAIIGQPRSTAA